MHDDEYSGRKIGREMHGDCLERLDGPRRTADHDHISGLQTFVLPELNVSENAKVGDTFNALGCRRSTGASWPASPRRKATG